jgi:hypothetical protein
MKVELFYIAECPNYREAARVLRETLLECGFRDEVSEIEVTDTAQAQALAFIGSPSMRQSECSQFGSLSCRLILLRHRARRLAACPTRESVSSGTRITRLRNSWRFLRMSRRSPDAVPGAEFSGT